MLEKSQYTLIYKTSYLTLLTSLYAIYQEKYKIAIIPASIFLTSVNYWRKPDSEYRRYLDIITVVSGISYHHYLVYNSKYAAIYYVIMLLGKLSYICGKLEKDNWKSTYAHIGLHVLANTACIIVYSE
jgi:hypothetical protein